MVQQVIDALVPILITVIVAIFTAAIKAVGDAGINLINEKAAAVKAKARQDKWNHWMSLSQTAWNIVDEKFRITPNLDKTIATKQAEFETQIKKLIPGITATEIEQLRQAVAGEVNKGKAAIERQTADERSNGLMIDNKLLTQPIPHTRQRRR
jgi:hypothetical protein